MVKAIIAIHITAIGHSHKHRIITHTWRTLGIRIRIKIILFLLLEPCERVPPYAYLSWRKIEIF